MMPFFRPARFFWNTTWDKNRPRRSGFPSQKSYVAYFFKDGVRYFLKAFSSQSADRSPQSSTQFGRFILIGIESSHCLMCACADDINGPDFPDLFSTFLKASASQNIWRRFEIKSNQNQHYFTFVVVMEVMCRLTAFSSPQLYTRRLHQTGQYYTLF